MLADDVTTDDRPGKAVPSKTLTRIVAASGMLSVVSLIACICVVGGMLSLGFSRYVSTDDLPGTYRGSFYGRWDSTLDLRADGTYEETYVVRDGATYHNAGRWHVAVRNFNVEVVLDNAIVWSGHEPPLKSEWHLRARRDLWSDISLNAGDPDGVIHVQKVD